MGRPDRGSGRVLERRASRCATAHERGERESSEPRAQGPVRQAKLRVLPSSRDRSIEKPLAPSVGLNLVRADLELVRDKAGGRSRSGAQIARNEAEVAKDTKLKREPQAVCCPPRRRATRSRSAPVRVNALIRSSPGISSGKLAHLANSVSGKIEAGTDVSSDWSRGFPSLSLRYRL